MDGYASCDEKQNGTLNYTLAEVPHSFSHMRTWHACFPAEKLLKCIYNGMLPCCMRRGLESLNQ